jgi:hypothetical protein
MERKVIKYPLSFCLTHTWLWSHVWGHKPEPGSLWPHFILLRIILLWLVVSLTSRPSSFPFGLATKLLQNKISKLVKSPHTCSFCVKSLWLRIHFSTWNLGKGTEFGKSHRRGVKLEVIKSRVMTWGCGSFVYTEDDVCASNRASQSSPVRSEKVTTEEPSD